MRFAVALSLTAIGLLILLRMGAGSSAADGGGILTPPLRVDLSGAPVQLVVNSWFDHHNPSNRYSLPFTRWDSFPDPSPSSYCIPPDNCPCEAGVNCYSGHEGIDFSTNAQNWPVYASARGTVDGEPFWDGGFGRTVRLSHEQVGINTRYSHLLSWVVHDDQFVQRGQLIGYAGNTGNVTGVHLHFGAYNAPSGGTYIDLNSDPGQFGYAGYPPLTFHTFDRSCTY